MDVGTVVVERDRGVWVLTLHGEHDISVASRLREELERVLDSGSTVLVDLSAVRFIDSSVIGGLIYGYRRAQREHHRLAVVAPGGGREPSRLLALTSVNGILATYDDRASALAALAPTA